MTAMSKPLRLVSMLLISTALVAPAAAMAQADIDSNSGRHHDARTTGMEDLGVGTGNQPRL